MVAVNLTLSLTLWERAAPGSPVYELAGSVQPRQADSP